MIDGEFTISLSQWAMNIEKQRAAMSADNIANANTNAPRKTGNFDSLIGDVRSAVDSDNTFATQTAMKNEVEITTTGFSSLFNKVSLDEEIANLDHAKGRYKAIAEMLSRKFALLSIASKSK